MDKIISKNSEQVIKHVSDSIIALAEQSIAESGKFTVALSGGNTPKLLYQYLVNENIVKSIDVSKVYVYFSDERYVPHDDERSNYGLALNYLLSQINIPEKNIFPVNTALDKPDDSAVNYQNIICSTIKHRKNKIPEFDLIILGMGTDGHTASLFPDSELLSASDILVGSCFHSESKTDRISFTFPLINAAKNVFILAMGNGKKIILDDINKSEKNKIIKYPIQNVKPQGSLKWFI